MAGLARGDDAADGGLAAGVRDVGRRWSAAFLLGSLVGCDRPDPCLLYEVRLPGTGNGISPVHLVRVADRDEDGADELAIGVPTASRMRGAVLLFSGRAGRLLVDLRGEREREAFGAGLRQIGAREQDGEEVLACVRGGLVKAVLGPAASWSVDTGFGGSVTSCAIVGDADGDGMRDIVIASTLREGQAVELLSGRDGAGLDRMTWSEARAEEEWYSSRLRSVVVGTADLDADDVSDYVLARPLADPVEVTVRSTASGLVLRRMGISATLPFALLPCGDRDGDGIAELATASPGRIAILSVTTGEVDELRGPFSGELVDTGADLDGDDTDDFLLRTTNGDRPTTPLDCFATFFVVSGRGGSVLARIDLRLPGGPPSGAFLGDVDGDGRSEVAVAVPHADSGSLRVFSGAVLLASGRWSDSPD